MEPEPAHADDALGTATRAVQLVSLVLYCLVLWQIVADEPTALDRGWARARPHLAAAWHRATLPLRWRHEAPYVVWEAMTIVEQHS